MEIVSKTIREENGEKRKLIQIVKRDDDGRITHYEIPNYTIRNEFETCSERDFHRMLIEIIHRINKENQIKNKYLQISTQVAINRIIEINNKRNSDLYEEIKDKSIDYVIFDLNTGKIECAIELNGPEHNTDPKKRERDILVEKMFENIVKFIPIETKNMHKKEDIYNKIMTELETTKPTD